MSTPKRCIDDIVDGNGASLPRPDGVPCAQPPITYKNGKHPDKDDPVARCILDANGDEYPVDGNGDTTVGIVRPDGTPLEIVDGKVVVDPGKIIDRNGVSVDGPTFTLGCGLHIEDGKIVRDPLHYSAESSLIYDTLTVGASLPAGQIQKNEIFDTDFLEVFMDVTNPSDCETAVATADFNDEIRISRGAIPSDHEFACGYADMWYTTDGGTTWLSTQRIHANQIFYDRPDTDVYRDFDNFQVHATNTERVVKQLAAGETAKFGLRLQRGSNCVFPVTAEGNEFTDNFVFQIWGWFGVQVTVTS